MLFVPTNIKHLKPAEIPGISYELSTALKRLQIRQLGQITEHTTKNLAFVSRKSTKLVRELEAVIEKSRAGEPQVRREKPETIDVPKSTWDISLGKLEISTRLLNIFVEHNVFKIGDLQGEEFKKFQKSPKCGPKMYRELRGLITSVQASSVQRQKTWRSASPLCHDESRVFVIPGNGRCIDPLKLPVSYRLEGVLVRRGIKCLGDLDQMPIAKLEKHASNFGKKTVAELKRLLQRVANGDFDASPESLCRLTNRELFGQIDESLAALSVRDRKIILLRFGESQQAPWTLQRISVECRVTRERVRQVVEQTLRKINREGWPKLAYQLERLVAECKNSGALLTPQLLEERWKLENVNCRYSATFYSHLVAALNPALQTPKQL